MSFRLITLLLISGLFCVTIHAQDMKSYRFDYPGNNYGISHAKATKSNGIVVTGYANYDDCFLSVMDSTGAVLFSNLYSTLLELESIDVVSTYDGGYVLLAEINKEVLLLKTDSMGNPLWTRNYYYGLFNMYNGGLVQGRDSALYIMSSGCSGFRLLKTDSNGSPLWFKSYSQPSWAYKFLQRPNGNLLVLGNTSDIDFMEIVVIELNEDGELLWRKDYAMDKKTWAYDFSITQNGGIIITGRMFETIFNDEELFLLSLNDTGKVEWCKSICDTVSKNGYVTLELSDGYLVGGFSFLKNTGRHVKLITKFSKSGDFLWSRINGLEETYYGNVEALVQNSDGIINIISYSAFLEIYKTDENFENFCGYEYRDYHAYDVEVHVQASDLPFSNSIVKDSLINITVDSFIPDTILLCAKPHSPYTGDTYISSGILQCPEDGQESSVLPLNKAEHLLYPQPAQDNITFETEGEMIQEISIFSIDGYLITQFKNIHCSMITIPINNYPNGTYILSAMMANGNIITEKLIVVKP